MMEDFLGVAWLMDFNEASRYDNENRSDRWILVEAQGLTHKQRKRLFGQSYHTWEDWLALSVKTLTANQLRYRIIADRDGEWCWYCGADNTNLDLDHQNPRKTGGPTRLDNLVLSCRPCNFDKDCRTVIEWQFGIVLRSKHLREPMRCQIARYDKELYHQRKLNLGTGTKGIFI